MEENKKNNTHGGYRKGAGRKCKQDVNTKVMRIPGTDTKTVEVLVDLIHAHTKNRAYKFSNKEIVDVIQTLEWTILEFKHRVQEKQLENLDDIPFTYRVDGW